MRNRRRIVALWFIYFLVEILKRGRVIITIAVLFFVLYFILKHSFLWN